LSLTSKYGLFKSGFGPFAPEIVRLPVPDVYRTPAGMSETQYLDFAIHELEKALVAQIDPKAVAAMIIEPVQGEAGFVPVPPRFLTRIRELCTEHGIVMIADEVQCGMGRTGRLFAIEHYGLVPDLITMAKSLGAGCRSRQLPGGPRSWIRRIWAASAAPTEVARWCALPQSKR
jgi:4-aminobutyrate aminotransferase/(S)-3-amino-2-methylpropionate transaminase